MTDSRILISHVVNGSFIVRSLDLDDVIKAFPCQKTRSKPF